MDPGIGLNVVGHQAVLARRRRVLLWLWIVLALICFIASLAFLWNSKRRLPKMEQWLLDPPANKKPTNLELGGQGFIITVSIAMMTVFFIVIHAVFRVANEAFAENIVMRIVIFVCKAVLAICKAALGIHLPYAALIGSNFAKDDIFIMYFLVAYCYHVLFCMLAMDVSEDFGVIDFFVAVALGFVAGSPHVYGKAVAIGSVVALRTIIPFIIREVIGLPENSILPHLDPLLRPSNRGQAAANVGGQAAANVGEQAAANVGGQAAAHVGEQVAEEDVEAVPALAAAANGGQEAVEEDVENVI